MTTAGWLMMIVSVGFVVGLVTFCFYRVLTTHAGDRAADGPTSWDA